MSTSPKRRRPGRPRGSGQSKFRLVPVWKQDFDRAAFARALLLLAIHLDENKPSTLNKANSSAREEGEDHE